MAKPKNHLEGLRAVPFVLAPEFAEDDTTVVKQIIEKERVRSGATQTGFMCTPIPGLRGTIERQYEFNASEALEKRLVDGWVSQEAPHEFRVVTRIPEALSPYRAKLYILRPNREVEPNGGLDGA